MSLREPKPLSEHARRLLAAERELGPTPPELSARVLERAQAARTAGAPPASTGSGWTAGRWALAGVAAASAVALVVVLFRGIQPDAPVAPSPSVLPALDPPATASVPSAALSAPDVAGAGHAQEPLAPSGAAAPRASTRAPAPAADAPDRELALMQQARAALAAHDPARALRALNEHARRFPNGALAEEREGLRIAALQAAGKSDEAQRDADRFKKRYPRSVLSQPSSGPVP